MYIKCTISLMYLEYPIWKFLGCGNLAARLLQPCKPLQGAHNLAIIPGKVHTTLQRLYIRI